MKKKVCYCHMVHMNENAYLYYNSFKDCFLILNRESHNLFKKCDPEEIKSVDFKL